MKEGHSVIIVDDEAIIREGLTDMVDWAGLGFEVAGCFADGRDAIEYLEQNHVDVVLTDIKMDDVGGIEIARYAHEHRRETRIVIVSGHREFSFARDALRFGATSYLLKPIDFEELQTVFADIKRELTAEGRNDASVALTPERFASDIVTGRITSQSDLTRLASELRPAIEVDTSTSPAALILVDFEARRGQTQDSAVRDGIVAALRKQCAVSLFVPALSLNNRIVVLALDGHTPGPEVFEETIRSRMTDTIESLRSAFHMPIVATILACEGNLSDLVSSNPSLVVQKALAERRQLDLPARSADEVPFLRRIIEYLDEHYAEDVSLADASALAYLSPVYFGRVFRERVGVTFTEYLASVRISKAIELLRDPQYKIHEVGEMVGYPNPRYFARVFRTATGYTPRAYRTEVLTKETNE
jgi:two-component system response regulator YesN